jgi:hypothetical protein
MKSICLSVAQRDLIWGHLLPDHHELEEAAFLFVHQDSATPSRLICEDVRLLGGDDLSVQLSYHIELADHVRPQLIKQAHDTGLILVEVHSHLGHLPARFSKSDLFGFDEWVPHMRWRLKGRAYVAVVVAKSSFDGFVWLDKEPERLESIEIDGQYVMKGTALSPFQWIDEKEGHDE